MCTVGVLFECFAKIQFWPAKALCNCVFIYAQYLKLDLR